MPGSIPRRAGRLAVLRQRHFRWFFAGYGTSLFGSSMSGIALVFAILGSGGTATMLGTVRAVEIAILVLLLLYGGVVADRLPRRVVMLAADTLRCLAQGALAVLVCLGHPPPAAYLGLGAGWAVGEAFFDPALSGLVPEIVPDELLPDANALLGLASSVARVGGPAAAGLVIAVAGPGPVIAVDAATYAVSVLALSRLPVSPAPARERSFRAELREGWSAFSSRVWLWTTTLQFALFNMLTWAPFLVLGPVVAARRLGGARAWGAVLACYGLGGVAGGLVMIGKRPARPLVVGVAATFGFALPPLALAAGAPAPVIAAAALVAGFGSSVYGTLYNTVEARRVPHELRARIGAYTTMGAFAPGAAGLALAGPAAALFGTAPVFWFGAIWQVAGCAVVLALPATRAVSDVSVDDG